MDNMDQNLLDKLFNFILNKAHILKENAGYNGQWNDGGAGALENEVAFYKMGMQQKMPESWKPYVKEMVKEMDPEYAKYLELKKKFD